MDMYMFGREAVGTTATNSHYDLDISASPEPIAGEGRISVSSLASPGHKRRWECRPL